jgi:large subunit ribosomal protein L18
MEHRIDKGWRRERAKYRIRKRVSGSVERPRLVVFRSLNHIYAQAVDDASGRTLAAASTLDRELRGGSGKGGNLAGAKAVGASIAKRLVEKGHSEVVFDRGGYVYHGRVKVLAEAARENGLKF